VPRVYRVFLSLFEGQCSWSEVLRLLDNSSRDHYFRQYKDIFRLVKTYTMEKATDIIKSDPSHTANEADSD